MSARYRIFLTMLDGLLFAGAAAGQQWPSKPIRFITVGASDAFPRILGQEISGPLGQQVIVEEHAGASGTIGAEFAARQPPDGYTFMVATSTHMVVPNFYKLSYDIMRDFAPISLLGTTPFILIAHPSLPVQSLVQLIALAKKKPGQLNFSATSAGSSSDLVAEMFKSSARVNIVHVPYKSMAAALTDVLAGQVQLSMSVGPTAVAQIRAHKVRALAVSTPKRSVVLPDVPTFVELGFPKVVGTAWFGLVAPAGTPPPIINRMNAEVVKAIGKPDVREKILNLAFEPAGNAPDEFRAFMQRDLVRWAEAAKAANVKIEVPRV
jgi:tripartite-type tricarboxylate transporter receptor subunit TctC